MGYREGLATGTFLLRPTSLVPLLQDNMTSQSSSTSPWWRRLACSSSRDPALLLCLQQFQCYDDEAGIMLRSKVVTELDTFVKQWIRSEGLRKRITWSQLEQVGGKVVSYYYTSYYPIFGISSIYVIFLMKLDIIDDLVLVSQKPV